MSVRALYCNGLQPCLEVGAHDTTWLITCALLTAPEDLKVLINEGLIKICPLALVPKEYEALQFRLVPGDTGTRGDYLAVGMSMLSDRHMCIRDILLYQPDSIQESP